MTKHHYVYHSYEEWGREYIGVRSCDCLPEEDIKYFGSFTDKTFKPTEKTILFVCETRKEIMEIEIELHNFFDVAVNPKFVNRSKATSTGFDRAGVSNAGEKNSRFGVTLTEETKKKLSEAMSGRTLTEEHKKKLSEAKSGEKNLNYGRTGALSATSKAIIAIEPDGTKLHFVSGREAARELGIDNGSLSKYARSGHVSTQGKWKGWQFLLENR